MEEIYATMSPARLRAEFYYCQIGSIRRDHNARLLSAQLGSAADFGAAPKPGAAAAAKRATLELLDQKVAAGEVDAEMAEVAKEEFGLIRLVN
ncbi:MAG TPA: hypothetical protein VHC21_03455 [Candidatus Saccharimonadales bacterium]|nr:hypothetical protein [Candidatus Saccharimonadales bacterium]